MNKGTYQVDTTTYQGGKKKQDAKSKQPTSFCQMVKYKKQKRYTKMITMTKNKYDKYELKLINK
jgi:hypothetical protein